MYLMDMKITMWKIIQLTSRFEIYDNLIEILKEAEALMYPLGEGGITAERFSKGFADALLGQIALLFRWISDNSYRCARFVW